ncbi:unnamed protein product [Ophioblennius macclurei]
MLLNNNNQKAGLQSAAARLAQLPLVHSACAGLTVLYTDTKRSHPGLTSMLESSVMAACVTVSPVVEKLGPQICVANAVACKSLDWLEASFPVLLSPTDQIIASAKSKLQDIQDAVRHRLMRVTTGTHQGHDDANPSLVERAISAADVGLSSALNFSETLLDQVLPPDEDKEADRTSLEGFDVAKVEKGYPERVVTLAVKLCRRTYCVVEAKVQSSQIYGGLPSPSALMQDPQTCLTLLGKLQDLPEYLQRQALSVICFVFNMYHLFFTSSQRGQSNAESRLTAETPPPQSHLIRRPGLPRTVPRLSRTRLSMFDRGYSSEGRLRR